MSSSIDLLPNIQLGVVPTHIKFVGGLVPDDDGKLPRAEDGALAVVAEMAAICEASPVKVASSQVTVFPGTDEGDVDEMISGLRALDLEVHIILMVGGADPMNPDDEDAVVDMLKAGLGVAIKYDIAHVSSTSFEEWMAGEAKDEEGFKAAVVQVAKAHIRAWEESGAADSKIENWHLEFLRCGEFQNFTNIAKAKQVVSACNAAIGSRPFRLMVDAAHCGDSGLSIPENEALIAELAENDEFGIFHASAKTTRGCLSTDDGWIGALMTAAAKTGKLKHVFVEIFHHEDAALEALRELDPGHGIVTTDGRTYRQTVIDGLVDVTRRLNNLSARGVLS